MTTGSRRPKSPPSLPDAKRVAKAVGAKLRDMRDMRGLSQPELATLIGVQPNYISMAERGVRCPRLHVLVAWAHACRYRAEDVLSRLEKAMEEGGP